jgi:hypothetical protein
MGVKKPSAADRTVDLFTRQSNMDAASEVVEAIQERVAESIEVAAERWRNNALFTAEHLSKCFNQSVPETAKFRLTEKGDQMFLEKFSLDGKGQSYGWAGVMFHKDDLYELTSVFVRASKARAAT